MGIEMRKMCSATVLMLVLVAAMSPGAKAIDFTLEYSDPASDVMKLNSSTMNPVIVDGEPVMSPFPDEINILWLRTGEAGTLNEYIEVRIEVKGQIVNRLNTTYTVNLYTNETNETHYIVNYTSGYMWIRSNVSAAITDITGNSTIGGIGGNTLILLISKDLLGEITAFNVDAYATIYDTPYSYRDFGWMVPGHPGSTPTGVEGTVYGEGDTPLEGATVSTEDGAYATLTDANGAYILQLPSGSYTLIAEKDGYKSQRKDVVVESGQLVQQDFHLEKAALLPGFGVEFIIAALIIAAIAFRVRVTRNRNR